MYLDPLDRQILEFLKANARMKNTQIAKALNMTEGAIRKRIKRLEEEGIIQGYTAVLAKDIEGLEALVFLTLNKNRLPQEITNDIVKINGVQEAWVLTGETDIVVRVHCDTPRNLDIVVTSIREIDGVKDTTTHVILKHVMGSLQSKSTLIPKEK